VTSAKAAITVQVCRGPWVESVHQVHAVVARPDGTILQAWGDPAYPTIPRSAVKPFQTVPLIESGAAEAFGFTSEFLALSSASHGAAPKHMALLEQLRDRLGLTDDALECGAHRPLDQAASDDLLRAGKSPCRLHNNCSGQHLGFIATALHLGENPRGYSLPDHPVQARSFAIVEALTGCAIDRSRLALDGCNAPTYALPLHGYARAAARFADPSGLDQARRLALAQVFEACAAHPDLVAGDDRLDTAMMRALAGQGVTKIGAEGVVIGALRRLGLGFAIKVVDGASRAADAVAAQLLIELGAVPADDELERWASPVIKSATGDPAGRIVVELP
jgi:L-asparaginase II